MSSYRKLLEKLVKANSNIESLIYDIIKMKSIEMEGYCCHSDPCENDCGKCKREYLNNLYKEMIKEYSVD